MKFFAGILVALAMTIAWQTSVLSGQEPDFAAQQAADDIQSENRGAGREPFDPGDCD